MMRQRMALQMSGRPQGTASFAATAVATLVFAVLALMLAAPVSASTTVGATSSETGAEQTRAGYIRALEPICARNARQSTRILKGVRKQVARGQLAPAARRFARATRAFSKTVRQVLAVQRPAEDRSTLTPWIKLLKRQRSYLAQITTALKQGNRYQAQRLSVLLMRNADQANSTVTGYGFKQCLIRPNKFL